MNLTEPTHTALEPEPTNKLFLNLSISQRKRYAKLERRKKYDSGENLSQQRRRERGGTIVQSQLI